MGIPGSESCEGPAALERSPLPGASGVCSWEIAAPHHMMSGGRREERLKAG